MKRKIFCLLGVIFLGIFQTMLSAGISSRIEGVVLDRDTGKPLENAHVVLYMNENQLKSCDTDKNGYFKFEMAKVIPGLEFYIQCYKGEYVPFLPDYYSSQLKSEYFKEMHGVFTLEEGQIKHIKISLVKGGILKGFILKKEPSGLSAFKDVVLFLKKKKKDHEHYLKDDERFIVKSTHTDENGEFFFEGLEPTDDSTTDEYIIDLDKSGYVLPDIGNITIKKGEENQLDYTVDLTNPTGLKGTVKINGKIPLRGAAILYGQFQDEQGLIKTIICNLDENGNYFFQGIHPGRYKLEIGAYLNRSKKGMLTRFVEIIDGKSDIQNINIEVE